VFGKLYSGSHREFGRGEETMKDLVTRVKKDVRRVLHNNRGFTLIELLIVLAIIGIIGAIAVPRYTASLQKAKESACAANIAVLESAVMRYWADNDFEYPENLKALESEYIKEVPECPDGGTYQYEDAGGYVTCTTHSSTTEPEGDGIP
jgi:prepilin-type N-terminal cleavage/methylation domain-containing protein